MTLLQKMIYEDLPVGWTTILLGFEGFGHYHPLVSPQEVIDYATTRLDQYGESSSAVVQLAAATPDERDLLDLNLRRLAELESWPIDAAVRQWRLVLLIQQLAGASGDAVEGLIELTEFWASFDYPPDSPHRVQGRDSSLPPPLYYTQQNLRRALEAHRNWVERERAALRARR